MNKSYLVVMICMIGICVGVIFYQQSKQNNTNPSDNTPDVSSSKHDITSLGAEEFDVKEHLSAGKYTIFKFGADW
ncbi:hypothetical protein [Candidatus Uabimicrobium sp. HlEnr_7]|uniref:hypothetical protein n=1 Tax=Candidatus Uabimicrobium helgolandensis TaxID=3095367 RepID=UPI003558D3BE